MPYPRLFVRGQVPAAPDPPLRGGPQGRLQVLQQGDGVQGRGHWPPARHQPAPDGPAPGLLHGPGPGPGTDPAVPSVRGGGQSGDHGLPSSSQTLPG